MLVEDSQCAAYVTEFGSQTVNTALSVVQGIVSFLSVIGSVLLILTYVQFKKPRSRPESKPRRLLITNLAAANLLIILPNFLSVFMKFRTRFKVAYHTYTEPANSTEVFNITEGSLSCSGNTQLLDHSASAYCNLCVYLEFVAIIGILSSIFWTVCVCIHYFILISYMNYKLASRVAYAYYVIAWFVPSGISLWLLFHNWLGFEPTYSTVNCGIRTTCVPHHHPYHYQHSYSSNNWNRIIGVVLGVKIWQAAVFLIVPCLLISIRCKYRSIQATIPPHQLSTIKNVDRKILLIPIIYMLISAASFVSDLYFFLNHDKHLQNLQSSNDAITLVHFLMRICDNSQGVINFCLFCLFDKEARHAIIGAVKKQLCPRQPDTPMQSCAHVTQHTPIGSIATPPVMYGATTNTQQDENTVMPSPIPQ